MNFGTALPANLTRHPPLPYPISNSKGASSPDRRPRDGPGCPQSTSTDPLSLEGDAEVEQSLRILQIRRHPSRNSVSSTLFLPSFCVASLAQPRSVWQRCGDSEPQGLGPGVTGPSPTSTCQLFRLLSLLPLLACQGNRLLLLSLPSRTLRHQDRSTTCRPIFYRGLNFGWRLDLPKLSTLCWASSPDVLSD